MKVMEIQSIKRLSSTHCPLVPLGKGHKSAKNIAPAIEISPPGAALRGREAVNERRQPRAEAAGPGEGGDVGVRPGRAIPTTDALLAELGNCFLLCKQGAGSVRLASSSSARTAFCYITSIYLVRFSPPNLLCVIECLGVSLKEIPEDRKCSRISATLNCDLQSCSLKKIT